jgi:hypothetical protein
MCMAVCTSIMLMMTLCPYWFLASWTATVSVSLALTSHTLIKNKQCFSCGSGFNWFGDPEPESGSRQEKEVRRAEPLVLIRIKKYGPKSLGVRILTYCRPR